jgi:hypothetical protein
VRATRDAHLDGAAVIKVVKSNLARKRPARRPKTVNSRRIRASTGEMVDLFTVDANSATLDADLTYVFTQNIEHARRENQRLFGSADGLKKRR